MSVQLISTGFQLEALQEALLFAYPTPQDFRSFLLLRLNRNFNQLAGILSTYEQAVLDVLTRAMAEGWIDALFKAALNHRPNSPKLKLLGRNTAITRTGAGTAYALEDIVRARAGFQDLLPWLEDLERVAGCVCRVEYPVGQAIGTGFLIADDHVMTNWHVVREVKNGSRNPNEIALRFDYAVEPTGTREGTVARLASDWHIDSSPASELELGTGNIDATANQLDYAVVRLAEPIGSMPTPLGRQRGSLPLVDAPRPGNGDVILVVQHPAGAPLKLALGAATNSSDDRPRFHHDASTVGGSSGSPILNERLQLIGLHNCGDVMYNGDDGGARLLRELMDHPPRDRQKMEFLVFLMSGGAVRRSQTAHGWPPPPDGWFVSSRPFVDRDDLRRLLRELASAAPGPASVLVIEGDRQSGKSHGIRMAIPCAPADRVVIDIDEWGEASPMRADDLARAIDNYTDRPNDNFPAFDPTKEDEAVPRLLAWLVAKLRGRNAWIIIDHLNRPALTRAAYDLVCKLAGRVGIGELTNIRMVIAGIERNALPGGLAWGAKRDMAILPDPERFKDWCRSLAQHTNKPCDDPLISTLVNDVFNSGGTNPGVLGLERRIAAAAEKIIGVLP